MRVSSFFVALPSKPSNDFPFRDKLTFSIKHVFVVVGAGFGGGASREGSCDQKDFPAFVLKTQVHFLLKL